MTVSKIDVGDRAPGFVLPDIFGVAHDFYNEIDGRPIVLVFFEQGARRPQIDGLAALHRSLTNICDVQIIGIFVDGVEPLAAATDGTDVGGPLVLADIKGKVTQGYASLLARKGRFGLVLDPNQRIVALPDGSALFDDIAKSIAAIGKPPEPRHVNSLAPVLIIPNLISRPFCERLIQAWQMGERNDGVVLQITGDQQSKVVATTTKRRTDHFVSDPKLRSDLAATLGPRVAEELRKAFFFERFRFEAFRVGCYSWVDRGFFKRHRDFVDTTYESRRFAVSLNLNTEDYVGGDLRFPEYGPDLYRPPTGGAVVFSGSLMHEVLPVTSGERFVLLTFLLAPDAKPSG